MVSVRSCVLLSAVVFLRNRIIDCCVALRGHPQGHLDGAHHGDGVKRVQEVWEHQDLEVILHSYLAEGVKHHGEKINKVKHRKDSKELIERVLELPAKQEEDGDGVPGHAKEGDQALHYSFKNEMEIYQLLKFFIRGFRTRGDIAKVGSRDAHRKGFML